jgi:hypothetical protein
LGQIPFNFAELILCSLREPSRARLKQLGFALVYTFILPQLFGYNTNAAMITITVAKKAMGMVKE